MSIITLRNPVTVYVSTVALSTGKTGWISLYKYYSSMLANYQRTDTKMKVVGTLQAAGDSFMAYKMGKGKNSKLLQELKEKYNN